MENTLQNKSKFRALYFHQDVVLFVGKLTSDVIIDADDYWPLKLTPLSSITDEDAIDISKIGNRTSDSFDNISDSQHLNYGKNHTNTYLSFLEVTDYLRSKGYALPYMGLSVEKQIEYGWVKLEGNL